MRSIECESAGCLRLVTSLRRANGAKPECPHADGAEQVAAAGAPNRSLVLSSPSGPTDEDILKHAPIRAEVEAAWKAAATHTPSGARPAPDDVSGCGSSEPVQHTWRTPGEACRSGKPGPGLCEVGAKGFSDRVATTEESAKPHWGVGCGHTAQKNKFNEKRLGGGNYHTQYRTTTTHQDTPSREQSAQRCVASSLEQPASQWSRSRRSLVVQRKAHRNGVHLVLRGQATRGGLS